MKTKKNYSLCSRVSFRVWNDDLRRCVVVGLAAVVLAIRVLPISLTRATNIFSQFMTLIYTLKLFPTFFNLTEPLIGLPHPMFFHILCLWFGLAFFLTQNRHLPLFRSQDSLIVPIRVMGIAPINSRSETSGVCRRCFLIVIFL